MCNSCTMDDWDQKDIENWAKGGCKAESVVVLQRPSAQSYPNTFVIMWKNVRLGFRNKVYDHLCLDVHYQGDKIEKDKALVSLGGLWVKGITGAMKPQQHPGQLSAKLKAHVSSTAPDPDGMEKFGNY